MRPDLSPHPRPRRPAHLPVCLLLRKSITTHPPSRPGQKPGPPPSHPPHLICQALLFLPSKYLWNASPSLSTVFTQATFLSCWAFAHNSLVMASLLPVSPLIIHSLFQRRIMLQSESLITSLLSLRLPLLQALLIQRLPTSSFTLHTTPIPPPC